MRALTLLVLSLIVTPIANAAEGKLTFSTFSFPPFSDFQGNKVVGPFADIIDAVCHKIDIACEYQNMSNRRSKQTLKDGTVNGNFPLGWNKERDGYLWFTIPLMKTEYGFFVKADSTFEYKKLKDLEGMTVGVFGPSNTSYSLQKIREQMKAQGLRPIEIDMTPNADGTGLKKVAAGRVQLYYVNRDVGFYRMKQLNVSGVRYAGKQKELYYFAGFSKDHNYKAVIDKFNAAARDLSNEGVIAKLLEKYHIDPARWDDKTLAKYNVVVGLP
jgi:polar amino acid transport system substrate-binding protein